MLDWQLNQTAHVPIKNIEVDPNKSKRGQESHLAHRLESRGLGFLDRWCSWRASACDERKPPPNSGLPRPQPGSVESGVWFSPNIRFLESPIFPRGQQLRGRRTGRVRSRDRPELDLW